MTRRLAPHSQHPHQRIPTLTSLVLFGVGKDNVQLIHVFGEEGRRVLLGVELHALLQEAGARGGGPLLALAHGRILPPAAQGRRSAYCCPASSIRIRALAQCTLIHSPRAHLATVKELADELGHLQEGVVLRRIEEVGRHDVYVFSRGGSASPRSFQCPGLQSRLLARRPVESGPILSASANQMARAKCRWWWLEISCRVLDGAYAVTRTNDAAKNSQSSPV